MTDESAPASVPTQVAPPAEPIILFRNVCPTDLNQIFTLEKNSYPADEKASSSQLQHRQHHAVSFFRCAVLLDPNGDADATHLLKMNGSTSGNGHAPGTGSPVTTFTTSHEDNRNSLNGIGQIIGFITGTRCRTFDEQSMKSHDPTGKLLAIHSVVVSEEFRKKGIGTQMLENYLQALKKMKLKHPIEKVVLITKMKNIGFYLRAGFGVLGKSKICHGKDTWYDCEYKLENKYDAKKREKFYECWIMDAFATPKSNNNNGMLSIGGASIVSSGKGSGNPAGVVLITDGGQISVDNEQFDPTFENNQEWMKIVAREFNLSETAFIWKKHSSAGDINEYYIRYYTCDGSEVDLCGHATLAASSVVFQKLLSEGRRDLSVIFHSKYNVLKAKPASSGNGGNGGGSTSVSSSKSLSKIIMEFPTKEVLPIGDGTSEKSDILSMVKESIFPTYTDSDFKTAICEIGLDSGGDDLLVEVTADAFFSISQNDLNFTTMANYDGYTRGIIVCCAVPEDMKLSGEKADFFSRFFGPKVGIEEDPVTGSAHCALGPYFGAKLGKKFVVGSQRSKRGGIVECSLIDDKVMRIAGTVTKAMSGKLFI